MMSRVEELKQQIRELQKQLKIEEEKEKETAITYPFAEEETCYHLQSDGRINPYYWRNEIYQKLMYSQGNYFKTREEATLEQEKRKLLMKFKQFRDKCNKDWKPNFDNDKWNTYIAFHHNRNKLEIHNCCNLEAFNLFGYFKYEADAERAIELFGDEIKRLFVEE